MSDRDIEYIAELIATRVEGRLNVHIASQSEICRAHQQTTMEHRKTLYGNGTPGLKSEVVKLRQSVNMLTWVFGTIFAAIVAAMIMS